MANGIGPFTRATENFANIIQRGIGLQQNQQILDRQQLESELNTFNTISRFPYGPMKKAALKRFLPRLRFDKNTIDVLIAGNEQDFEFLNQALQGIVSQLPEGIGLSGLKQQIGRMDPSQLIDLIGVGLNVFKAGQEARTQQLRENILGGEPTGGQPTGTAEATSGAPPGLSLQGQINRLRMKQSALIRAGLHEDARAVQQQITSLQQQLNRQEGLSPAQFEQQLELSKQKGSAALLGKEEAELQTQIPGDVKNILGISGNMTVGEGLNQGITVPDSTIRRELVQSRSQAKQAFGIIENIQKTVSEKPEAIGVSGDLSKLLNGLSIQSRNVLRAAGIPIESDLDINSPVIQGTLRDLGITNEVLKSQFFALAIAAASARGLGTGRALSDQDLVFMMRSIGASAQDPKAMITVLERVKKEIDTGFRDRVEGSTGRRPPSLLGGGSLGTGTDADFVYDPVTKTLRRPQ